MSRRIALAAAIALAVLAVIALRGRFGARAADLSELVRAGDARGYNVLLVTLDTVRADRLGCYGRGDAETPTLDSLCRNGVRFEDAVTSVPITLPSHATIMTGLSPQRHGVRDNGTHRLADEHTTLAEDLRSHGYETAAFLGCFVLDARFGLDQGFDEYDFEVTPDGYRPGMFDFNERPAAAVTGSALRWFDARGRAGRTAPFFVWVHYFDPHLPYRSPLQSEPRFASRPYDAEIAYVDQQLGRLLDDLKRRGQLVRTLVVVVADHGEALGEHGEPTHGMLLYEPTVRVPFILSCPALFRGAHCVSDEVVGLIDVRATVGDLLGIAPPEDGDGRSLARPAAADDRVIYLETEMPRSLAGWSPLYAARSHTRKYILAPEPELYDLAADPAESRNIIAADAAAGAALADRLAALMLHRSGEGAQRALSDEEQERLASLGYVGTGARPEAGLLPDPKKMMTVYADALRAEQLYHAGRTEEAAALAAEVLEKSPACTPAVSVLSFSYLRLGRPDNAVNLLRASMQRGPDVFLVRSLAQALIVGGRFAEARDALDVYELLDPRDGRVALLRGDILAKEGRRAEATAEYARAMRLDETRVGIAARDKSAALERPTAGAAPSSCGEP